MATMTVQPSHVWLRSDLAAILAALAATAQANGSGEYQRGFLAALAAVAMALSIAPGDVVALVGDDYTVRW
jgi:hypothetical protein